MLRFVCLLAVGMLTSCTTTSSGSASAPSHSPAAVATSAQAPSPSPTPQIACELPYLTTNGRSPFTAVGFLKLPGDVFSPDPTAGSALPPGGVQASPVPGAGATQPWWDAQAMRWVPVDLSSVSPDGQSYVYLSADGLHRVLVATGADQLVYRRPQGVLGGQVLGYQSDVYIVFPSGVKDGAGGVITNPPNQVGVWRIDLAAKTGTRIRSSDIVGSMASGALWITPVSGNQLGDSLDRIDLGTGNQTVWFSDPGRTIQFLGVDNAGLPIVWTFANGHLEIWRVAAPNQATNFYSIDYAGVPAIFGPEMQQGLLVADEHGVWFGASDGLYIYDAAGFRKIATTSGIPSGPCQ
jgi:hypothetical protein